ncbi:MAG: PEGA domain-containing protein [Myxococcales bacterium]|jgi:hypothetical protein|nr:PEGA domain-containing protein [Myxococcales bacterium]
MKTPRSFVRVLVAAALLAPSVARAADPPSAEDPQRKEEARGRFNRGVELYQEGDFRGALAEFRRAYELVPSWRISYNIAQACAEVQDYACALQSFDQYLAQGGAELAPERRAQVEADVKKLRARIAKVTVRANRADAEIFVDEASFGRTPLRGPALVGAGKRRISATLPSGQTVAKVIEVAGGDAVEVSLVFPDAQPSAPPKPAPLRTEAPSRAPIYVGLVATGALAAGATVTGVMSLGAKKDLDRELDRLPGSPDGIDDARSRARTFALVTDILGGAAVVAAGVTVVLVLTRPSSGEKAAVSIDLGPGSAGVRGRF